MAGTEVLVTAFCSIAAQQATVTFACTLASNGVRTVRVSLAWLREQLAKRTTELACQDEASEIASLVDRSPVTRRMRRPEW